jgi:hypothetical protein
LKISKNITKVIDRNLSRFKKELAIEIETEIQRTLSQSLLGKGVNIVSNAKFLKREKNKILSTKYINRNGNIATLQEREIYLSFVEDLEELESLSSENLKDSRYFYAPIDFDISDKTTWIPKENK